MNGDDLIERLDDALSRGIEHISSDVADIFKQCLEEIEQLKQADEYNHAELLKLRRAVVKFRKRINYLNEVIEQRNAECSSNFERIVELERENQIIVASQSSIDSLTGDLAKSQQRIDELKNALQKIVDGEHILGWKPCADIAKKVLSED